MPVATKKKKPRKLADKIVADLTSKAWRMSHLYRILDKTKTIVRFVPNEDQANFYANRHTQNIVVKARKRGLSTAVVIDYFDDCVWAPESRPVHAAHCDLTQDDAFVKIEMAKLAWDQGPLDDDAFIAGIWKSRQARNPLVKRNTSELVWENGSKQQAAAGFVGSNPSRLHISEFGPISVKFPLKASEIVRGTLNAAAASTLVDVESTMEGGSLGECGRLMELAMEAEKTGKPLTRLDWRLHFISWLSDPECDLPGEAPVKQETRTYFQGLSISDGVTVSPSRQAWYEKKKATVRAGMFTQFPTVVREALFMSSGAPYFEPDGLRWQQDQLTPLTAGGNIMHGDIVVQGDVQDKEGRSADWRPRIPALSPYRIFEPPLPDCRYVLFCDPCVGKQAEGSDDSIRDTHSYGIIRDGYIHQVTNQYYLPQIVGMCQGDDRCPITELIRRIVALSIYYGDCLVIPETNNMADIATRLIAAGVRNMYAQGRVGEDDAMPGTKKTEKVWGWLTQEDTRRQMLEWMQEMTIQQEWLCTFPEVLSQMSTFVLNKKGKPVAAAGAHDDHVLGVGIGLFNLRHAMPFRSHKAKIVARYQRQWEEDHGDPTGI